jgi:tetratricopeptide (TPR) repeat protein
LLAAGEDDAIRSRHVAYYLDLVERAQAALVGPEEGRWLARLEDEHPNLRAALRRTIDQGDAPVATRFAAVLWRFWAGRGHLAEGRRWLEEILALTSGTADAPSLPIAPLQRAMLLHVAGNLVRTQGGYAPAHALYEECLAIRRSHHDGAGIAGALHNLGIIAYEQGDYAQAVAYCEEALPLVRQAGYVYGISFQLTTLGNASAAVGATERAIALHTEAQGLFRQVGHTWGSCER